MVTSFDQPNSKETKDFWLTLVHREGQDSGGDLETLSGWITAFIFWDERGNCLADKLHSFEFITRHRIGFLDGVQYHLIRPTWIPEGLVSVPVVAHNSVTKEEIHTIMVAGSVGITVTQDGTKVQPRSGWWMLKDIRESH